MLGLIYVSISVNKYVSYEESVWDSAVKAAIVVDSNIIRHDVTAYTNGPTVSDTLLKYIICFIFK